MYQAHAQGALVQGDIKPGGTADEAIVGCAGGAANAPANCLERHGVPDTGDEQQVLSAIASFTHCVGARAISSFRVSKSPGSAVRVHRSTGSKFAACVAKLTSVPCLSLPGVAVDEVGVVQQSGVARQINP